MGFEDGVMKQNYTYKTKEKTYYDNLIYFGARYYDPLIGRFTTPDPMGMIDGPNRYLYCNGDPVNGVDYWGYKISGRERTKLIFSAIYGGIGGIGGPEGAVLGCIIGYEVGDLFYDLYEEIKNYGFDNKRKCN